MSRYTLEEEEQIAGLKAFWSKYGNAILIALIIIFGSYASYNGYRWFKGEQSKEAVVAYERMQEAVLAGDSDLVEKIAQSLKSDHASTPYASRGLMLAAKAQYDAGKKDLATGALQWVVDNADLDEYAASARLTLSGILMEEGSLDNANQLLSGKQFAGFEGLFTDRRADIALIKKDYAQAKSLYAKAKSELPAGSPWIEAIEKKLSAIPSEG